MIDSSQSDEGDRPVPPAGAAGNDPMIRPQVWPRARVAPTASERSARRVSRSGPPPAQIVAPGMDVEPLHVIADLTPPLGTPGHDDPLRSVAPESIDGSQWSESVQGWVRTPDGRAEWRTILTTADAVDRYATATQLGLVTGEAAVSTHGDDTRHLGGTLARARETAIDGMTRQALARGAHAVVAISIAYAPFAATLLVTATGTAVTLASPTERSQAT